MEDMNEKKKLYYISVPGCSHFRYLKFKSDENAHLEKQETYEHCLYFEKEENAKELLRKIKECIFDFCKSHTDREDIPYPEWVNEDWVKGKITDEFTTIQEANTEICRQYEEGVVEEAKNRVCFDGLLYKGEAIYKKDGEYWCKKPKDEEEKWRASQIRPLFLTKASNDIEGWDIRKASGRDNRFHTEEKIGALYYQNIMRWLCGLMGISNKKAYPKFETLDDKSLLECFDASPIAIINVNKRSGIGEQADPIIAEAIKQHEELLKKQILLLQPNVIFCCHGVGGNPIINFLKSEIYKNCREFKSKHNDERTWIYYSPSMRAMIVHCCSPSYRKNPRELYERTMREIEDHLPKCVLGKFDEGKLKDLLDEINYNNKTN